MLHILMLVERLIMYSDETLWSLEINNWHTFVYEAFETNH